jgi:hypothetical protein
MLDPDPDSNEFGSTTQALWTQILSLITTQVHISVAAEKMVGEDYWGAMLEFESILAEYPLDPYSLHMAYFLALTIGNTPTECH